MNPYKQCIWLWLFLGFPAQAAEPWQQKTMRDLAILADDMALKHAPTTSLNKPKDTIQVKASVSQLAEPKAPQSSACCMVL